MSATARVGMLSVLWIASAGAADPYSVREDVPETGSNIQKTAVSWRVPVEKRYAELTSEELRIVHDDYVALGARATSLPIRATA